MSHPSRPIARAVATASLTLLATAGGCASLGLGGSSPDASIEIRNTAGIGVNLYMLPRTGLREVFLGQVGPQSSRRVRIERAAPGDTVWLRARPVDGRPEYARDDLVLGRESVWQIP